MDKPRQENHLEFLTRLGLQNETFFFLKKKKRREILSHARTQIKPESTIVLSQRALMEKPMCEGLGSQVLMTEGPWWLSRVKNNGG